MREPAILGRPPPPLRDETAPVWVLDDPLAPASTQAIGIAERLGVPHVRVPLAWNWRAFLAALPPGGSLAGLGHGGPPPWPFSAARGPALALSSGAHAPAVALWLRRVFGTRVVQCGAPRFGLHATSFDLLVVPGFGARAQGNVLPVLGAPHRLSPLVLSQARLSWAARLAHLPRPLVTVLAGALPPAAALALGAAVTRLAASRGGSVLASTSRRTSRAATEALAAGLAPSLHLLYRWGEPGDNPYAGFIGLADSVIVTGGSVSMLSEACAGAAPVFVAPAGSAPRHRRLHAALFRAGHARPLGDSLSPWPRTPLDEAGRVATEIRARMALGPQAVD